MLRGVAPGRYRLRASAYASTGGVRKDSMAVIPVDVGTSDMDGVDVVLDSGGTVDVALHGLAENQIEPKDVSVNLRGVDAIGEQSSSTGAKDGGFHLDGLAPGSYRLSLAMPEDICVESVKLGREVRGLPFDVPGGAAVHLDVAVSRNCGAIRMRAMRDDAAVPGAKVVLLLSGTAKDPGDLKEDFANDEGELSFWPGARPLPAVGLGGGRKGRHRRSTQPRRGGAGGGRGRGEGRRNHTGGCAAACG